MSTHFALAYADGSFGVSQENQSMLDFKRMNPGWKAEVESGGAMIVELELKVTRVMRPVPVAPAPELDELTKELLSALKELRSSTISLDHLTPGKVLPNEARNMLSANLLVARKVIDKAEGRL